MNISLTLSGTLINEQVPLVMNLNSVARNSSHPMSSVIVTWTDQRGTHSKSLKWAVERIYVPYPMVCDLAIKALYFVFEGIDGCAKEIKDAPILASSVPFRQFDDDDDI